jgi:acyl carrier protein
MAVVDTIRQFLATELRIEGAESLDVDLPLVQSGIIDSIELLRLVSFLEAQFRITVEDTDVLPANLRSMRAMAAFVARKQVGDRACR